MTNITAAKSAMRDLGMKASDVVKDDSLTMAEKKSTLDNIEADLKSYAEQIDIARQAERLAGAGESPAEKSAEKASENGAAKGVSTLAEFVGSSDDYAEIVARSKVSGRFTKSFEHPAVSVKAANTITEGQNASGYGMDGIVGVGVTPTFLPGIVDLRFQPLTVADLMGQGSTESPLITYVIETAWNDNAAAVAEGGLKPQSDGAFSRVTDQVGKIANTMKLTDEMIQDAPQFRSFLQNRLTWSIQRQEEAELLNGNGYPGVKGLMQRTGMLPALTASKADAKTIMDTVYAQITALRTLSFCEPDAFVMNPADWEVIRLASDKNGQYYAGGPFAYGPYGNATATNEVSLWGLRGVLTTAVPQGTVLVGGFKENTQIFRRQGITLEMTNSNEDDFKHNLVLVRAEERLGLAVYRPQAFTTVTIGA